MTETVRETLPQQGASCRRLRALAWAQPAWLRAQARNSLLNVPVYKAGQTLTGERLRYNVRFSSLLRNTGVIGASGWSTSVNQSRVGGITAINRGGTARD